MESEIINWLASLSDKQFIEVFYKISEARKKVEGGYYESHFVLLRAEKFLDSNENVWQFQTLCKYDETKHTDGWQDENAPICQYGSCSDFETASYVKDSICPICSSKVYGT